MRIQCDHCSTRYAIADEKVLGRLIKIRCKKCQTIILVRGPDAATPDDEPTQVGHEPPPPDRMVGERNESSQLFSLDQLQSIAQAGARSQPAPAVPTATSDASGLIDIRRMAQAALSQADAAAAATADESGIEPPAFVSPLAAPILLPEPPARFPVWAGAAVIASVLALSGTVLAVWSLRPRPAVVTGPRAPIAAPPIAAPRPQVTALPPATPVKPPEEPPVAPAAKTRVTGGGVARGRTPARRSTPAAPAQPGEPVPPPQAPAPRAPEDELTRLLEQATPNKPTTTRAVIAPVPNESELPDHLERHELSKGFDAIQPKVEACFATADARGPAMMALVLAPGGTVSSAAARGSLQGSATGECLERAARSARFPRWRGAALSITYAFIRHGRP
jgi:predicted Zn finger-like uncharacterized protein